MEKITEIYAIDENGEKITGTIIGDISEIGENANWISGNVTNITGEISNHSINENYERRNFCFFSV